jgi:hypothetical protein
MTAQVESSFELPHDTAEETGKVYYEISWK